MTTADRPGWTEVLAILVACAIAFIVVAALDRAAHERETRRAQAAIAERAREASGAPAHAVARSAPRAGGDGTIPVSLVRAKPVPAVATVAEGERRRDLAELLVVALVTAGAMLTLLGSVLVLWPPGPAAVRPTASRRRWA